MVLSLGLLFSLSGCKKHSSYLGYVEGRLTYISAPFSGKLTALSVERGQKVNAGELLFKLEQQPQSFDLDTALATVRQISADLADKQRASRPSEQAAIAAQLSQAQAELSYAQKDFAHKQQLVQKKAIEQNQLDIASKNLKAAQATVSQYEANLATSKLGGREEQIQSLQAQLSAAKNNLEKAQWNLSQKTITAPVNAQVFDIYYRTGEQAPANQAVISLLAPQDIKVIFFVDEAVLSKIKTGQIIQVNCDACRRGMAANIRFISPSAEYTPPIIYSRSARSKLVYEVEAAFVATQNNNVILNPGQPVEVTF